MFRANNRVCSVFKFFNWSEPKWTFLLIAQLLNLRDLVVENKHVVWKARQSRVIVNLVEFIRCLGMQRPSVTHPYLQASLYDFVIFGYHFRF